MGAPNIQQQMYLKKALNENMDGMFNHPEQLDESYTMRKQYGRRAKMTPEQREAAKAKRAAAKAEGDAHVAKMSETHTWVKGSGKNGGKWVPKQETNESTYAKSERASRRTGNFAKFLAAMDRRTANEMRRGGASRRTMKAHFNKGDFAAGSKAIKKFETDARRKQMALSPITEGLLNKIELAEGSRGTKRLERMTKSLVRNRRQGMEMIGKAPKDFYTRSLVSPNDPEVKAYKERAAAGVAHMEKKRALRNQINARTRAAAMRERGRAGLHPRLNQRDVLSPSIPSAAHQGKPINVTGGYEHQENPKRVPKAVQKYRDASWRKMMRGKKS
jgi:hypothetical protein